LKNYLLIEFDDLIKEAEVRKMKKKGIMTTFLGEDTEFDGKLVFHGALRIDGRFQGEISAPDGNLIIGEKGLLKSDVFAASIVISGEIHGNIKADKRIEIFVPGKVFGDIQAPVVVINEGVIFKGNCCTQMLKKSGDVKLAVVRPVEPEEDEVKEEAKSGMAV
jgi:cytoskeletal protein CcmA (bactofilin family)